MALPPIRAPQYGDQTSLEKLGGLRTTRNPATPAQRIIETSGGRPSQMAQPESIVQAALQQLPSAPQAGSEIAPEHDRMLRTVALLQNVALEWVQLASRPDAGPMTKAYARAAVLTWRRAFDAARSATPFFMDVTG